MVHIENWKVYDLEESVIACRNSMRTTPPEYTKEEFEKSLPRAIKLAKTPSNLGEDNFLCGIRVAFDIKYPNYFTPELQRYHFLDIVSSSSKIHKLAKMDMRTCFNKYVTEETRIQMSELVELYNNAPNYENFMLLISNCPLGVELFMRCTTNYRALKTIYKQRKTHRLREDWVTGFCKNFIEKLPYFNELISQ
jgi:hypothetical protein